MGAFYVELDNDKVYDEFQRWKASDQMFYHGTTQYLALKLTDQATQTNVPQRPLVQ